MAAIRYGFVDMVNDVPDHDNGKFFLSPASTADVNLVLAAPEDAEQGHARSPWTWIRFPNGDLALATFPQDVTYFAVEEGH